MGKTKTTTEDSAKTKYMEGELLKLRYQKTDETVDKIIKEVVTADKKADAKQYPYGNPVSNGQDNSLRNWFNY